MFRDGKMHGNNAMRFVCILFFINKVCSADIEFLTHNNDVVYDVTTIYEIHDNFIPRLSDDRKSGFMNNDFMTKFNGTYSISINPRTNAIGMPIDYRRNVKLRNNILDLFDDSLLQNNKSIVSYDNDYWNIMNTQNESKIKWNNVYTFSDLMYMRNYGCYQTINRVNIFSFTWTPEKEPITCLSFTYKLKTSNGRTYELVLKDSFNNSQIISVTLEKGDNIKTIRLNNIFLIKELEYNLSLLFSDYNSNYHCNSYESSETKFTLITISECSTSRKEISLQNTNGLEYPYSFNVLEDDSYLQKYDGELTTNGCLNGGYKSIRTSKCICPPGFKGQFCETGCGPNSFGDDCKGICSLHDRMCRGMLMCTAYGCTCPVGLTGSWCNQDCESGKYGADCKQTCSPNCYNNMCNQYTGTCSRGCVSGYVMPYCLEKYPYLVDPPELISSHYESLEIKFNFNSTNIKGGGTNIKLKYYQLVYKILGEQSYNTSDINFILNGTNPTIIINGLDSGTPYEVGAILITDDGNFNDQDIIYGQFNTSCNQPRITGYNVKLVSGINSINVTWNTIQSRRYECDITEYVLTLNSNEINKKEIFSCSGSGLYLNDLLSGIEYKIQITGKTMNGLLESSPVHSAFPLMKENDVEIKNISTIITNEKIKVFWKMLTSNQQIDTINGPVTFTVKYKLTRVFSCSLREIENEWTSLTIFNQSSFEIFDTVPNAQYTMRIIVGNDYNNAILSENIIYALTPLSSPKTKPILDIDHPTYVTNNSVYVKWKVDPKECSKLNGFFSKFYFVLKDEKENILRMDETKENSIYIDNLNSNTSYELSVFIKTNYGMDPEHFLAINFKTKNENLKAVEDLMVYKKSHKGRMVGIRWSYSENSNLNGFLVSFDVNTFTNTTNTFTISPEKCTAWPEYYCHTFHNLTFNKSYKFSIKPTSVDYPEGGNVSSISFGAFDGLPDSPRNIKTTEIGSTTINLQWDIPWIFNGVLKMFIINVEEISSADINTCCTSITPIEISIVEELPTYNYTLVNLQPGSTYSIGVITVTNTSYYSAPARTSATTLI